MNIFKEIIESINNIDYALKMQAEGNHNYLSMEMGNRDFISRCYCSIGEGLVEGQNRAIEAYGVKYDLKPLTKDEIRNETQQIIIQGCYKEGASKEFLKDAFSLTDNELDYILSQ